MSDSLAERLKKLADDKMKQRAAEEDIQAVQVRVNAFIAENARTEFTKLQEQLKKRIDEVNPQIGDLPKYEYHPGSQMIQQGNCVSGIHFDQPYVNGPNNRLLVSFGTHPNAMYFSEADRPEAIRYLLQAAANDNLDGIVWVGDLGELTTEQLCEFILENLTEYYLENRPQ
jgi:hypothetical protein